jgi:hypothetical protein
LLYFRLYFLSPRDGRILRFTEFEALDDNAALALAEAQRDGGPMELWCRDRKVRTFAGSGTPAGSGASPSRPSPGSSAFAAFRKPARA